MCAQYKNICSRNIRNIFVNRKIETSWWKCRYRCKKRKNGKLENKTILLLSDCHGSSLANFSGAVLLFQLDQLDHFSPYSGFLFLFCRLKFCLLFRFQIKRKTFCSRIDRCWSLNCLAWISDSRSFFCNTSRHVSASWIRSWRDRKFSSWARWIWNCARSENDAIWKKCQVLRSVWCLRILVSSRSMFPREDSMSASTESYFFLASFIFLLSSECLVRRGLTYLLIKQTRALRLTWLLWEQAQWTPSSHWSSHWVPLIT